MDSGHALLSISGVSFRFQGFLKSTKVSKLIWRSRNLSFSLHCSHHALPSIFVVEGEAFGGLLGEDLLAAGELGVVINRDLKVTGNALILLKVISESVWHLCIHQVHEPVAPRSVTSSSTVLNLDVLFVALCDDFHVFS